MANGRILDTGFWMLDKKLKSIYTSDVKYPEYGIQNLVPAKLIFKKSATGGMLQREWRTLSLPGEKLNERFANW